MDWFHCNLCYLQKDAMFYITSCGHILCQTCITRDNCRVCRTACRYLAISENLKPQEKMFFRSLKETALKYFDHIGQVWSFQKQQHDLHINFYKQHLSKTQNVLQEALQRIEIQESEMKTIKRENAELKSLVNILKGSLGRLQSNRVCTPRPVGITSPSQTVTPRHSSQHCSQIVSRSSSTDSLPYVGSRSGGFSQPASAGRTQERSTPLTSDQGSPMSLQSVPYGGSSHSTSMLNFPFLCEQSNVSGDPIQTRNTPNVFPGESRDSRATPGRNTDRLRPIQLQFTPRTPSSRSYHSRVLPNTVS
ncbi:RING finger protein 212B [Spea bombifrons]|uniref:RING finger protein 212B n=1 Tax=Spea bombifrons TaxID=233779 RepID=UPI0023497556|nr:RING finger protein 212B [Spea bombifrons]